MIIKETKFKYYNQHNNTCQWKQFIEKSALSEKNIITNDSIIENDQAVIGTYIRIYKYGKGYYIKINKKKSIFTLFYNVIIFNLHMNKN